MLFFSIIPTTSCAFLPAMNKNLHAAFIKICTSSGDPLSLSLLLKCNTRHLTMLTSTVGSPLMPTKCQWISMGAIFFLKEEFNCTPVLHLDFRARRHFVRLPLCCMATKEYCMYHWLADLCNMRGKGRRLWERFSHFKVGEETFALYMFLNAIVVKLKFCYKPFSPCIFNYLHVFLS